MSYVFEGEFDYMAAFFAKLSKRGINVKKIDQKVHDRLRFHFLTRLQGAAQPSEDPDVALQVYEQAKLLLGTFSPKNRGLAGIMVKVPFLLAGTDGNSGGHRRFHKRAYLQGQANDPISNRPQRSSSCCEDPSNA